ncbi:hypothetical protein PT2222_160130 [Paraburkholderia tropica]
MHAGAARGPDRAAPGPERSIRVRAEQSVRNRRRDDAHVEPERPVAQVIEIVRHAQLHFFEPVGFAAKAVDLRPAGDAGLDAVTVDVARHHALVEIVVFERVRTRADHRHVAAQHVVELRQFVETRAAQERAHARHAAVAARGLAERAGRLAVHAHRAELVDREHAPVRAFAPLLEQHRSRRRNLHRQRNAEQHRHQAHERARCEHAVEHGLLELRARGQRRGHQIDRGHAEQFDHAAGVEQRERTHIRNEADVHEIVAKLGDETHHRALLGERECEPQFMHVVLADELREALDGVAQGGAGAVARRRVGHGVVERRGAKARAGFRIDAPHDLVALRRRSRNRHLMQIHARAPHVREHAMRDHAPRDQQRGRHRGPVREPQPRHRIDVMHGRVHGDQRAALHDDPRERHLARHQRLRAAAPRLIQFERRKDHERERRRQQHKSLVHAARREIVETDLRRHARTDEHRRHVQHSRHQILKLAHVGHLADRAGPLNCSVRKCRRNGRCRLRPDTRRTAPR